MSDNNGIADVTNQEYAGTLNLGASSGSHVGSGTVNLQSGGILTVGAGGIANPGGTYAFNLNGGTLQAGADFTSTMTSTYGPMTVVDGTSSTIDPNGHAITFNGGFTGSGGVDTTTGTLTIGASAAGTVTFSGASYYSGNVILNGGTVILNQQTLPLGSGTLYIEGGTKIDCASGSYSGIYQNVVADGSFTFLGSQTMPLGNSDQTLSLSSDLTITSNTGNYLNIGSQIIGNHRLTTAGAGEIYLSNGISAASYNGLTVNAGTLWFNNDMELGAVPAVATPGNFVINGGATLYTPGGISVNSNRGITIGPGTVNLTCQRSNQGLTYGGVIADSVGGPGSLYLGTNYVLTLGGANTYSGTTSFASTSAKLNLQNQYAVQDSTINFSSGAITFTNGIRAANMAGFFGSRPLALNDDVVGQGVNLIIGGVPSTPAYTMVYSGALSGYGGLTLNGGTLSLSGNNTFTGACCGQCRQVVPKRRQHREFYEHPGYSGRQWGNVPGSGGFQHLPVTLLAVGHQRPQRQQAELGRRDYQPERDQYPWR